MFQYEELISVLEETRRLLARPENDFSWSSWADSSGALEEIDQLLTELKLGNFPEELTLKVLFAPTGPIQEVSLSSGWGEPFLKLAERFDAAFAKCT